MGRATINFVYDRYIKTKTGIRRTTREGYNYTYNHYVRETFGKRKIAEVKYSDVLFFYEYLVDEEELSYSVVDSVHSVLHPTFELAVRDDIIRKNPSDGVLGEIKKSWGRTNGVRHALTIEQQKIFVGLLDLPENQKWKPIITFLLGTGCRVGECIGIRWQDVDLDGQMVSVNHSVSYLSKRDGLGETGYFVFEPKTRSGNRSIPLLASVREAL